MSIAICHSCHCRWKSWVAAGCGVEQRWRHRGAEVLNAWLRCCLCGTLRGLKLQNQQWERCERSTDTWQLALQAFQVNCYIYIDTSVQRFSSLFMSEIKEESPQYLIREHSPMMFDLSSQVGIMGWSESNFDLYIWWKVLLNKWSRVHLDFWPDLMLEILEV